MTCAGAAATLGAATCGAAGFMAWAVRGRASCVLAPSVYHGPRGRHALALTFDDGPSEDTPRLLDVLAHYGVRATFFQCGANAERLPEVARAVATAGHEIGNHGYAHQLYSLRRRTFIEADVSRAQRAIATVTGVEPRLFRAPFGVRWFGLREVQRRLGLLGVTWSVIGYDWRDPEDSVIARILGRVSNGAIVCLHDGRELRERPDIEVTIGAVRSLVPRLLDRGYKLETVSQLLCRTTSPSEY